MNIFAFFIDKLSKDGLFSAGSVFRQMLHDVTYKKELIIIPYQRSDGLIWDNQVCSSLVHIFNVLVDAVTVLVCMYPTRDSVDTLQFYSPVLAETIDPVAIIH